MHVVVDMVVPSSRCNSAMQNGRQVTDTSIESSEPIESRGKMPKCRSTIPLASYKEVNAVSKVASRSLPPY